MPGMSGERAHDLHGWTFLSGGKTVPPGGAMQVDICTVCGGERRWYALSPGCWTSTEYRRAGGEWSPEPIACDQKHEAADA